MSIEQTYFRKGFGLKDEVRPRIEAEYHSALVEEIRAKGYQAQFGEVTVRLAEEFGFCYGVDRAVDYAYETRKKFPEKTIYLVGEIIHNPHVNRRMREMDIEFVYSDPDGRFDFSHVKASDVVLLSRVRGDDSGVREPERDRMHLGRYDLRLGPFGVEARGGLCARRIHFGDPWEVCARGEQSYGVPGSKTLERKVFDRSRYG